MTGGWHLAEVNESLVKHGSHILPADDTCQDYAARIFVPLCGKTVDMAYLASKQNVEVIGLDGIRLPLEEFATEHPSLQIVPLPASNSGDKYERLAGKNISFLKGDYFDLDETAAGGRFDAVWDRASIIAIEPHLREQYVETMSRVIKPGGTLLVSTLERRTGSEEGRNSGPPFSVPEAEVRRLYEGQNWVESVTLVEETDQFAKSPADAERFSSSGVTSMYNLVFVIKTKA
jgi:thiopurine S-methyltransferase